MTDVDEARAITIARAAVGAHVDVPAVATRVRRLDRDDYYVIVHLGHPNQSGSIVAVQPDTADVMTWANNPTGATTIPDAPPGVADAEYVWAPSQASRSPLYPLVLFNDGDARRLRNLAGEVFPYPPPASHA